MRRAIVMDVFGFGRANLFKVVLAAAAALLTACLLALAVMEKPAGATFPGENGKIAYVTDRFTGATQEIEVMDADGSNHTRLTNNAANDFGPAWSSDGTKIAF